MSNSDARSVNDGFTDARDVLLMHSGSMAPGDRMLAAEDVARMFESSHPGVDVEGLVQRLLQPYPPFTMDDFRQGPGADTGDTRQAEAEGWVYEADADHSKKHKRHDHPWCGRCLSRWLEESQVRMPLDPIQTQLIVTDRARRYLRLHGRPPRDCFEPEVGAFNLDDLYLGPSELENAPAPDPLIEGVLHRNAYAILRGRDASFKSFIALDWALSLATGTDWQGQGTEQARVLYVAGEGVQGLRSRIQAWQKASGVKVTDDWFTVRAGGVNMFRAGADFDHLLSHVDQGRYGLVVLDTLRRMSGGAVENSSDMGVVVDNVSRVRDRTAGGSVLVVAHTGKGDDDTRGFSGIEDDSDIVWAVKRAGKSLKVKLTCTKMKDGPDGHCYPLGMLKQDESLVVGLDDGTVTVNATDQLSGVDARIMQAMQTEFLETGATVSTLVSKLSASQNTVYRSRKKLLGMGLLRESGGGFLALVEP